MSPEPSLNLSVSKVKTFSDCRKKFHFSYVLRLPRKDFEWHITGKFVHKVLEDFHHHYILDPTSSLSYEKVIKKAFSDALTEYKERMTATMKAECAEMIKGYLNLIIKTGMPNVLAVERKFELNLDDQVRLVGVIDRVEQDSDGVLHLSDYKTSKNKKYVARDFFQLNTYAMVQMTENPALTKVRLSYIMLRHDFEQITTEMTRDQISEIKQQYLDYATKIKDEKEYPANPTKLCGWCEFLDQCPEGKSATFKSPQTIYGEVDW
jgi:putative RecB family exonuclease